MRLEVVELGMHVRVDTGETVRALFLKVEGYDQIIEAVVDDAAFDAIYSLVAAEKTGERVRVERVKTDGTGVPPGFEHAFDGLGGEPDVPPGPQKTYVDQALESAAGGEATEVDEDGFEAGDG